MSFSREAPAEFRRMACLACGWVDVMDTEKIYRWLASRGKIRAGKEIEDDILYELFHGLTPQFSCPKCGTGGLTLEVVTDDFSDLDARRCYGCAKVIPEMRLQFFPDTRYCTACAEKQENGEELPIQAEYCPRCGAMMELVPLRHGSGKKEFVWQCTRVPSCRLKE